MTGQDVLSIDARWKTNADLIADVARLGYLDGTVLDATYGEGTFWKRWKPVELVTNDLHKPADHAYSFLCFPWPDGSFGSVVFDPDYKLNGTPSVGEMDGRYGTGENISRTERLDKITAGAIECFRVCRVYLLVKIMDQIEGGKPRWQTDLVTRAIEELGGQKIEAFTLLGGGRPQPRDRTKKHAACKGAGCDECDEGRVPSLQAHARRNSSDLLVFRKPK